jgi:hypothetical protein
LSGFGAEAVSGARSGLGPADAVGAGVFGWLVAVADELLGGEYVRSEISVAVPELVAGSAGGVCVRRTIRGWEGRLALAVRVGAAAGVLPSGWLDSSAIRSPAVAGLETWAGPAVRVEPCGRLRTTTAAAAAATRAAARAPPPAQASFRTSGGSGALVEAARPGRG